jgi:phosphoglycerate dehydrogenase-like enzyme
MAKVLVLADPRRVSRFGKPGQIPADWEVVYGMELTDEQRLAAAGDADYLYTISVVEVSGALIKGMPNLKLIQAEGVGFDKVDLAAATARGIPVCNCAGTNAGAVAEQTVLLILAVQRFLVEGHRAVLEGRYQQTKNRIIRDEMVELANCHVGLVGLGNIAAETAKRLRPFGCAISYWNRTPRPDRAAELGVDYLPLRELLSTCDVVSLHVAATADTRHLINADTLALMKPGAVLVNTARGALVDEAALAAALEGGRLGGAGLDVQAQEPVPPDSPLCRLSSEAARRLVLSPHLGGVTGSVFRCQVEMSWANLRRMDRGERPWNVVNGL